MWVRTGWSDRRSFYGANLVETRLVNANLERAVLRCAVLVRANLERARLANCLIYGMSAWDLHLDQAVQRDLDISWTNEPRVVVDNLEVARFVHSRSRPDWLRPLSATRPCSLRRSSTMVASTSKPWGTRCRPPSQRPPKAWLPQSRGSGRS
jgi:hypothetical protein